MKNCKGLLAFVFRNGTTDCTNKGISSKNDQLVIISDKKELQIFDGTEENSVQLLHKEGYNKPDYIFAVPNDKVIEKNRGLNGPMFGGNFLHSSDSRFAELNNGYPIPIHDRFEAW